MNKASDNLVLENPIWHGLNSGNKHLSEGDELVRYFPDTISPFAGLENFTDESFRRLSDFLPTGSIRATFTPSEVNLPSPWQAARRMQILQMVHRDRWQNVEPLIDIVSLEYADIPDMIALTALTNPGPFNERTIEFGNYHGIRRDGQLVAMAGFRLQPGDFIEISAVCTRPGYTGNGYARTLLLKLINDIYARGKTPILHVKRDYAAAISLYESVGFKANQELHVVVFEKC